MDGWSQVVLWMGFAVIAVGMVGGAFLKGRRVRRRTYWLSWLVGGLVIVFAAGHDDAAQGRIFGVFCVVMAVMIAFFKSPYLKIGDKIYAIALDDRVPDHIADDESAPPPPRPADSYGNLSAATFWWLMTALLGAGSVVIFFDGWTTGLFWSTGVFTLGTGLAGWADGAAGQQRFRRQYVPAAVLAIVSIPLFMTPLLLYVLGFEMGRHFPRTLREPITDHTDASP